MPMALMNHPSSLANHTDSLEQANFVPYSVFSAARDTAGPQDVTNTRHVPASRTTNSNYASEALGNQRIHWPARHGLIFLQLPSKPDKWIVVKMLILRKVMYCQYDRAL
jgi:hypothetical protein